MSGLAARYRLFTTTHRPIALLLALLLPLGIAAAAAEDPRDAAGRPTGSEIRERIAEAEQSTELDETNRALVVERYRQALEQIAAAEKWRAEAERLRAERASADERLEQLRGDLAATRVPDLDDLEELTAAGLARGLEQRATELARARQELTDLDRRIQARPARRKELPQLIVDAGERLAEEQARLAAIESASDSPADRRIAAARRTHREASVEALQARVVAFEEELGGFQNTGTLLAARRDLLARRVAVLEELVQRWRDASTAARRREAKQAADEAYRALIEVNPILQPLAAENRDLALRRVGDDGLAAKIEEAGEELRRIGALASRLEQDFSRTRSRVDGIGRSKSIGFLLQQRRMELPDARKHTRRKRELGETVQRVQLERVELGDERLDLVDRMPHEVRVTLERLGLDPERPEAAAVEEILEARIRLLDDLIADYDRYFTLLLDIDARIRDVRTTTEEFQAYISERILWTPSADLISTEDFRVAAQALRVLADGTEWGDALRSLRAQFRQAPLDSWGLVALVLVLGSTRRVSRRRLSRAADAVRSVTLPEPRAMLSALLHTVLLSLFWPVLVWSLGWLLTASEEASLAAQALGAGLKGVTVALVQAVFWYEVFRPHGLAEAHFRWSAERLAAARRILRRILCLVVPAVFISQLFFGSTEPEWAESIGRLCLLLAMPVLSWVTYDLVRPSGYFMAGVLAQRRASWLNRLRYVWFPLAVATPLALGVLSTVGYNYTAFQLSALIFRSAFLLLVALLVYQLIYRWLRIVRVRIATQRATAAREAAEREQAGDTVPPTTETAIDAVEINQQTLRVARVGLFVVFALVGLSLWVKVLPALEYLRRIELWSVSSPTGERSVTLLSLLFVLALVFLAVSAVRNLAGLVEILMWKRDPADRGLRYAVTVLARYAIVIAAVIVAGQLIGIGWSKVQWLVAAVSVGLGFGLQEIFANFVSGIVLLLERPIRVGDLVTVAGVNGWVTRIQARATTIIDFDRRELVVPNREFVTGQLINWTLTDSTSRLTVPVGVAYGTNVERATELLVGVAERTAHVLADPAPRAILREFGDNALIFHVLVFIPTRDVYFETVHQLHTGIVKVFDEEGITIAFPQRDVHFDGATPLSVQIVDGKDAGRTVPFPERSSTDPAGPAPTRDPGRDAE